MILPEVPQKMSDKNLCLHVIEIPPQAGPEAKHKSLPFNVFTNLGPNPKVWKVMLSMLDLFSLLNLSGSNTRGSGQY